MKNLTHLDLSYNRIIDISVLQELKSLKKVWLVKNKIENLNSLRTLSNIEKIDLRGNKIVEIPYFRKLNNLKQLNLINNEISDVLGLGSLISIEELLLDFNKIKNINIFRRLENLAILTINNNQINNISSLEKLQNLKEISLNNNKIKEIPHFKCSATLEKLSLNNNNISNISLLQNLEKLKELDLSENQIKKIENLDLLSNLIELDLRKNKIENITNLNLVQLQKLRLSNNEISNISFLKKMKNLILLDLKNNPIKELESWICDFPKMDIKWEQNPSIGNVVFYNNPIKTPPTEIVKRGKKAIKDWFNNNNLKFNKMEQRKNDFSAEQIEQIKQLIKEEVSSYHYKVDTELLRMEAHETRMIAYFLLENEQYDWAIGWAVKSLKTYIQLYKIKSPAYHDLINQLSETISKLKETGSVTDGGNLTVLRKIKDFFETIIVFKQLNVISEIQESKKENHNKGIEAISNALNIAFELHKSQLLNGTGTADTNEIIKRQRVSDEEMQDKFKDFLRNPGKYDNINDFIY